MHKAITATALSLAIALLAITASAQSVTGRALVTSPTSSLIVTGSPGQFVYTSMTSSHWMDIEATANTFYSFTANYTYGIGVDFGGAYGNNESCTTDPDGHGHTPHRYEGMSGRVYVADGNGSASASATTQVSNAPMFFTKTNGYDSVTFGTYGEG